MNMLGAVLAGGRASRFGSDKALARLNGQTLLGHAVTALAIQCERVVVVGREMADMASTPDYPGPGMGPLGGIAGSLRYAREHGFACVLTCGLDAPGLPENLRDMLAPAPAYLASQPVIGCWPVEALEAVEAILAGDGKHSMRALAQACGARAVVGEIPANINTRADLVALQGD
ncbi:molybdenum cofactor guanylyltransferase [Erythrobacter sp. LQ02-29]|uniref:molybdenum cofactor guanylyltransferase n=1 Tax=Erythrobacter sp. LQ02-29 TaxID=2920384 RepID=UPI001F4D7FA6|nr:molybdenum cofactor guanylyltransferase [Erythrobacter sp. LQ02-29]MCP9222093.1 molybdenum cofactor guanylyltransferase [Erythrobacter sp. LQ02-29]